MANNIADISILSPLKWSVEGYANELPYNTKYRENFTYPNTLLNIDEPIPYWQPWQKNDIIYQQILSNYTPHQIEMYTCDDVPVSGAVWQANYKASSIEPTGQKVYEATIALNTFEEGYYFFRLKSGNPVIQTLISEMIYLKAQHENTVQFKYKHDENDFDTVFETGIELQMRVHGGFREFTPSADRTVFVDQPRNIVQLSAKSFSTEKLVIGDSMGVPDWLIEKINAILLCSTILIDGKQWVANEGAKLEPNREELYPLAGWSIELRPASNSTKKRFIADGEQGSPTTVVYNLQGRGFGPITGPASSNVIQIEEIE